ncbi:MAG TPA: GtrA family protein [Candidatus Dormibacteraeota bacterium]
MSQSTYQGRLRRSQVLAPAPRWTDRVGRLSRFAVVGVLGLAANQAVLWVLVSFLGLSYLLAAVVGSQASTAVSYLANELWVFRGRGEAGKRQHWLRRLVVFDSVNTASLLLRLPVLFVLTSGLHINYLISNLVAVGVFMLVRFLVADAWIWGARPAVSTI